MDKIDEKAQQIHKKYCNLETGNINLKDVIPALKEMALYATKLERERIKEQVDKLKVNEMPESLESEKAICFGFNEGIEKFKVLLTKDPE